MGDGDQQHLRVYKQEVQRIEATIGVGRGADRRDS